MMIVIMNGDATMREVSAVIARVENAGLTAHLSEGQARKIVGIIGRNGQTMDRGMFERMPGVERVVQVMKPYKLASREFHPEDTRFMVGTHLVGGSELTIMAGPCSVESRSQIIETAIAVKEAGAHMLRGGAYKPRTSPYSFQGMGLKGLEHLAEASEITGLPIVTEVMSPELVPLVCEYADVL